MPPPATLPLQERSVLAYLAAQRDEWIPVREIPNSRGLVIAHGSRTVIHALRGLEHHHLIEARQDGAPWRAAHIRITEAGRAALHIGAPWR